MPDWLATNARPIFTQMLLRTGNKIDGAIAANDNIAGAVVAVLKAKSSNPSPSRARMRPGRSEHHLGLADEHGLQARARRGQCGCRGRGRPAQGKTPPGINTTRKNGGRKEPTIALPVTSITKANYTLLFRDGFLKRGQVCVGEYKQYCK